MSVLDNMIQQLNELKIEELNSLMGHISNAISQRKQADKANLKAEFARLAAASGMTVEEVLGGVSKKAGKPVRAGKYANPTDSSKTWTGHGRKPQWVIEHLENGGSLDDLIVK